MHEVGSFNLTFYYLKFQSSKKEEYPYKEINPKERKSVLDKFGGVKIYRDSFRVRPYGEPTNDWLKLGARVAQSPAGAGQRIGDWRVRPEQTAGIITISRKSNPLLIDKSDRGALQENDAFDAFRSIIIQVIHEFELDRSKILNVFYKFSQQEKEKEREKEIQKRAEVLADKIVSQRKKAEEKIYGVKRKTVDLFEEKREQTEKEEYEKTFIETFKLFEEEIEEKDNEELVQVRALASLGLIVSSFSHELKDARNNFADIIDLEKTLNNIVSKESIEFKDGINSIARLKLANEKIVHWVDYSLTAIKKDKRKREAIEFNKYFSTLYDSWKTVLKNGNIKLEITNNIKEPYFFRAFEMDMNTIFNNLISNSIDAFHNLKVICDRKILINFAIVENNIQINYTDNGTGISSVFKDDKDEIFLPFITTKKEGIGLGMYLIKNVVSDNNGSIDILDTEDGFKLSIYFPIRKK